MQDRVMSFPPLSLSLSVAPQAGAFRITIQKYHPRSSGRYYCHYRKDHARRSLQSARVYSRSSLPRLSSLCKVQVLQSWPFPEARTSTCSKNTCPDAYKKSGKNARKVADCQEVVLITWFVQKKPGNRTQLAEIIRKKLHIVQVSTQPTYSSYLQYAYAHFPDQMVAITNSGKAPRTSFEEIMTWQVLVT